MFFILVCPVIVGLVSGQVNLTSSVETRHTNDEAATSEWQKELERGVEKTTDNHTPRPKTDESATSEWQKELERRLAKKTLPIGYNGDDRLKDLDISDHTTINSFENIWHSFNLPQDSWIPDITPKRTDTNTTNYFTNFSFPPGNFGLGVWIPPVSTDDSKAWWMWTWSPSKVSRPQQDKMVQNDEDPLPMIHPPWPGVDTDEPISIKASSGPHNDDAAPIIDKSWLRNKIRPTPGKDTPSSSQTTESWRTHKLRSETTTLGISSMMKGMVVSVKADNKSAAFNKDFGEVEDMVLIGGNMFLVIAAAVFNLLVIKFYKHQVKKLIPFIYFSVALADLVTALSCLLHPVILVLLMFTSSHNTLSSVLILLCFLSSSTSIRVGVFYNLILSVVRSINIVQPFYQVNLGYLKVASVVYPVIWAVVGAVDVYWVVDLGYMMYPKAMFKHMIYKPMSGSGLAALVLGEDATYLQIILFGMTVPFLIPSLLVTICLVFQIHYLNISTAHLGKGAKIVSKRPAITILQLTLLFITCNLTATAVFIYFYAPSGSEQRRTGARDARLMYVSSSVLHVFNATFSPLIMILRGRSLKTAIQSEIKSIKTKFSTRSSSVEPRSNGVKVIVYRY